MKRRQCALLFSPVVRSHPDSSWPYESYFGQNWSALQCIVKQHCGNLLTVQEVKNESWLGRRHVHIAAQPECHQAACLGWPPVCQVWFSDNFAGEIPSLALTPLSHFQIFTDIGWYVGSWVIHAICHFCSTDKTFGLIFAPHKNA